MPQNFAGCFGTRPHAAADPISRNPSIALANHAFVVSQSNLPQQKGAKMKAECVNQLELAVS